MKSSRTIIRQSMGAFVLGWALWSTPATAEPVDMLNPVREQIATSAGSTAVARINLGPYASPAIVMVTADGRSTYRGPRDTSGIVVEIMELGPQADTVRAHDDSLEGESVHVIYRASASYNFFLPRNAIRQITARTSGYGTASSANTDTSVRLAVIAIAAR